MRLADLLFGQGFGTRRDCAGLIRGGRVRIGGRVADDPQAEFAPEALVLTVDGVDWPVHVPALVVLHKPAGFECSQAPKHHPSVMSLLPAPLRTRGVQPVGRLDADTTGLLLLTDDGALIHRLTSPRGKVPKVYEVGCAQPVDAGQVEALLAGVALYDDPAPARASACELTGERTLRLTLLEGRYHQVKRMLAAVGNPVVALHRSRFGALELPDDLPAGMWRWLEGPEAVWGGDSPSAFRSP